MNRTMRKIDEKRMEMLITLDGGREISEFRKALPPPDSGFGAVYAWLDEKTISFFPVELTPGQTPASAAVFKPTTAEILELFTSMGTDYLVDLAKRCNVDLSHCKNTREQAMRILAAWSQRDSVAERMAQAKAANQQFREYQRVNGPRLMQAEIDRQNIEVAERRKAGATDTALRV